jgi:thiamine-phosphate diphosphorylase
VTGSGLPAARLLEMIEAAARAGVDLIQVRERKLQDGALLALVRDAVAAAGKASRVVVNERVDIALAGGAAGVHLRGDSLAGRRVRELASPGFLVGRSVHTMDEAVRADDEGAYDYLIFGTVFPSATKPAGHVVAGIDALAAVCRRVSLPVLAIGGVTLDRAAEVAAAGAAGVAALGLFEQSGPELAGIVRGLKRPFDTRSGLV